MKIEKEFEQLWLVKQIKLQHQLPKILHQFYLEQFDHNTWENKKILSQNNSGFFNSYQAPIAMTETIYKWKHATRSRVLKFVPSLWFKIKRNFNKRHDWRQPLEFTSSKILICWPICDCCNASLRNFLKKKKEMSKFRQEKESVV